MCSVPKQAVVGKEMKHHIKWIHKGFDFKLRLGFVKSQENVSEEVQGKVQFQVKAGIWLDKKKQSTT